MASPTILPQRYKSRPDIPWLNLDIYRLDTNLSPEQYLFATPGGHASIWSYRGELVWAATPTSDSYDLHPCDFHGSHQSHLCFSQGRREDEHTHGWGVVMNSHYQVVKVLHSGRGYDMHEFTTTDEGRKAIVTTYRLLPYDLSLFNISTGMGWLEDSGFRKIDILTGNVEFEWNALDHVPPSISTPIGAEVSGSTKHPFDYFHLNSVHENLDGDFLISARHLNAIFKISGIDGRVIWRLSSDEESSHATPTDFTLFGQHNARLISDNITHTQLSVFNNGANTWNFQSNSSALVVMLSHRDRIAHVIRRIVPPWDRLTRNSAFGSMQLMTNDNILVQWGGYKLSEHRPDGSVVTTATYPDRSYRTISSAWNGEPLEPPDVWAYSLNDDSTTPTIAYVSWNGATAVHSWAFYASIDLSRLGKYELIATVPKNGFETNYTFYQNCRWVIADARARNGSSIGRSVPVAVFRPGLQLAKTCGMHGCPDVPTHIVEPMGIDAFSQCTCGSFIGQCDINRIWIVLTMLGICLIWSRLGRHTRRRYGSRVRTGEGK